MSVEMPSYSNALNLISQTRMSARDIEFKGELPRLDASRFTAEQRVDMFNLATTAWEAAFAPGIVKTQLLTNGPEALPADRYRSLKGLRKYGLILKTGYLFLDNRHLAPPPFHQFVQELGQLNDHFFIPTRSEHEMKVRAILDEVYTPGTLLDFQPTTDETYRERIDEGIQIIANGIQHTELGVRDFHRVRKEVRHFMNIFQLAASTQRNDLYIHMFSHLSSLNDHLGQKHDGIVQKASHRKIDYESASVTVNTETQASLALTLKAIGR